MLYFNRTAGLYVVWVVLHFLATNLYPVYCAPFSFPGLLLSPFLNSTPHCVAMRWTIHHGSASISAMWVLVGSAAVDLFLNKA
jgi:hypothetical protein